ncbi:MAG TPA: two-component regulator propeller domain-containing protein [Blastocatellia bacterium]|nr:two-component regulator propeller domain-containing protein [Blastocatellia bacterium]
MTTSRFFTPLRSRTGAVLLAAGCGLCLLLGAWLGARAEQLPIKTWTTADGLLRDTVYRIRQDSRGFLWFCTQGGLSRFDGYQFTNYTMSDGLPIPSVNDLVEASDGTIWIGTFNGLIRFNPGGVRAPYAPQTTSSGHQMFEVFSPGSGVLDKEIRVLLADAQGVVWVGTTGGLYRMQVKAGRPQFGKMAISYPTNSLIKDHNGRLWAGTFSDGLYRLSPDGANILQSFTSNEGLPEVYGQRSVTIESLLEDQEGNLWIGTKAGVCQLAFDSKSNRYAVGRCYNEQDGLSDHWVNSLFRSSDGGLWIGNNKGLNRISGKDAAGRCTFQSFTAAQGFCDDGISDLAEDRDGNFWIASACGLKKWTRSGFTSYDIRDGLSSIKPNSFLETKDGELIVTDHTDERTLNLFREGKFKAIRPNYPSEIGYWGWGWRQTVLQTRDGEWWITVGMSDEYKKRFKEMPPDGPLVVRFPKVEKLEDLARVKPKAVYRPRDGLPGYNAFRIYEDHHGDVWIVTLDSTRLFRWGRQSETFQELTEAADIGNSGYIQVFREDRAGNLWIGCHINSRHDPNRTFSLMRYKDGRFTSFTPADGLPEGPISDLLIDGRGRLWMATARGGVLRVDDPTARRPHFVAYTMAQGLSDNKTSSLAEDRFGQIYVGSGRGVDRLDPATGAVRHFTTADGLPREEIFLAYADRTGALWFGSALGLARYVPETERPRQPPNILLTGLRVSNEAQAVSASGETEFPRREFTAAQNNLSIDFLGLGASLGEELRYQYKLEGADADWATATGRTVNFSNLAPGRYRFRVKALTAEGIESMKPAVFTFTILRPVWQRWWFLTLLAGLLCGTAYAAYRYRVAQLIELERVRTRIASDLHDDIGSNLSQIAVWSEVARRQSPVNGRTRAGENGAPDPLERIAATARETTSAMSDIVWAINPRRDHLSDLVLRMRHFAGETFGARDLAWQLDAPDADLNLTAETRRELFLIFKEGVNNIIRHAQGTRAEIALALEGNRLRLRISDDGCGFDPQRRSEGNGLGSMRERASTLGGSLEISSAPGSGTTVTVEVPLARRRWR